ncbi:ArsR family transcriptional regulator [Methanocella sp. CWC-04]|uniref:ArsR family transcriptional regulator n=1 Tax=Methanooceanicella nereidis TaxID=2052831 RepID=A0AAP2RC48_9EURY|nr:ArsR family transcriptional regulator [Methanocella sp. CWC-04]MCD1294534.1 ArsR family transcriptional regulator [Methanocella sp. CWC-04]
MDMAYLLDILGNENRRNILTLLSYRPCYVTEISEELKVSPKAIIDHLKILEDAGLVESFYDQQRRKYYEIANNVRIEVSISPLMFRVNVSRVDIEADEQKMLHDKYAEEVALKKDLEYSLKHLYEEFQRLNRSSIELQEAQRSVQGMMSEITGMCIDIINEIAADQIEAELLYMLVRGPTSYDEIVSRLHIPDNVARSELAKLMKRGLLTYEKGLWSIA